MYKLVFTAYFLTLMDYRITKAWNISGANGTGSHEIKGSFEVRQSSAYFPQSRTRTDGPLP